MTLSSTPFSHFSFSYLYGLFFGRSIETMTFSLFKAIEAVTAQSTLGIPVSIQSVSASLTGWPFEKPEDDEPTVADNHELTEDQRLDDPRHGQAKELNRRYR